MRISQLVARCAKPLFALAMVLLLGACAGMPPGKTSQSTSAAPGSAGVQDQLSRAEAALKQTAGTDRTLIFVGAALHSQSTAFQSDILAMEQRLASFGMPMQSILLSNPPKDQKALFPAATQQNLSEVFSRVGAWSDRYPITVVVLMSSHGNVDQLAINIADQPLAPIRSAVLDVWLRRLHPATPTALILSACHSGSFLTALRDGARVVLTASAADRSSFGCSTKSTNTWFIESLLDQGMRPALSWSESFLRTAKRVDAKERELKLVPSLPQASIPVAEANTSLGDWLRGTKP